MIPGYWLLVVWSTNFLSRPFITNPLQIDTTLILAVAASIAAAVVAFMWTLPRAAALPSNPRRVLNSYRSSWYLAQVVTVAGIASVDRISAIERKAWTRRVRQ